MIYKRNLWHIFPVPGNIDQKSWQYEPSAARPYEHDRGAIFSSTAPVSYVSKYYIIRHSFMLQILNLMTFENNKYTAYGRFRGNGPYGKIPAKKEPISTPRPQDNLGL